MRLDGELSEFEDALLTAHLHRCESCSEYDRAIRGAVLELRSRPLVELEHPVALPSRRLSAIRPTVLGRVAAIVVAAIGLVTVLQSQPSKEFSGTPVPRVAPSDNGDLTQARNLRLAQLGALPQTDTQLGVRGAVLQRSRL